MRALIAVAALAGVMMISEADALPDFELLQRSTVRIFAERPDGDWTGSGFVVSSQGHVVTNLHVIGEARNIAVFAPNSTEPVAASLLASSSDLDLALLHAPGLSAPPILLTSQSPRAGEDVWAIGYPGQADVLIGGILQPTLTKGIVSKIFEGSWNDPSALLFRIIQHSADINFGSSGGPLVDNCGRVIGVNTLGPTSTIIRDDQGEIVDITRGSQIFFASGALETLGLLAQHGISPQTSAAPCAPAPTAEAPAALRDEIKTLQEELEAARHEALRGNDASASLIEDLETRLAGAQKRAAVEVQAFQLRTTLGLLLAAIGVLLAIILALRKPRQKIMGMIEAVSRRVARRDGPGGTPSAAAAGIRGEIGLIVSYQDGGVSRQQSASLSASDRNGFVIGRDAGLCHLSIDNPGISKRHARLSVDRSGRIVLQDLNSFNGTMVGSQRLAPFEAKLVKPGASFVCGGVAFRVERS